MKTHASFRWGFAIVWLAVWGAVFASSIGCSNTRPCRQGTLFLNLKFGTVARPDSLTINVTVDGGPARMQTLPLSGASGGGVEITFPSGYPAGSVATVGASLSQGSMVIASRSASITLAPGCSSLEIDFGAADAGRDLSGGSGGQAGAGAGGAGTGGASMDGGSAGAVGSGGIGAGGTGTGGVGAGGVGTGGLGTGGGGMGTGGVGTGGAASGGRIGTGGTMMGTGGMGTGGVGTGGRAGCMAPVGTVENCYNNVDDDCNGTIDCADPACVQVALCEPLDPMLGTVGTSVAATAACPAGAPNAKNLQNGLTAAGCTGCSCATGTASLVCAADVYGYATAAECTAGAAGILATTLKSSQTACFTPNWTTAGTGNIFGIRASVFQGSPTGTCLPSGAPTKGTPVWNSTAKFCGVSAVGGGCAAGQICVPRAVASSGACMLMDGAQKCPATTTKTTSWYTGFTDTRSCAACACGAPAGGDCSSMLIGAGSDYSCPPNSSVGYVRSGSTLCFPLTSSNPNGVYSPGLLFSGTPQAPVCAASSALGGALTPSGPQTLCCL